MIQSVKPYLKIFSIILLIVLIIRTFVQCKGNFKSQVKTGILSSSLLLTLIYISNN